MKHKHTDSSCLFCKIITGDIPCNKIYESADVFAFLDINPASRGHTLVLPKSHAATLFDLDESIAPDVLKALKKIGEALMAATGATGFNSVQNNFSSAGQVVFHVHWHVIPRFEDDSLFTIPQNAYANHDEAFTLAQTIQQHIR